MHIGNKVKEILVEKGKTVRWFSENISCERTNAYKILQRESLNIMLLKRICIALDYDFFQELSDELPDME
jgi:predicted transcriptional regulator